MPGPDLALQQAGTDEERTTATHDSSAEIKSSRPMADPRVAGSDGHGKRTPPVYKKGDDGT